MVEFECVITNGYVAMDTIERYLNKGWTFVCTVPAKLVHPHAMYTDKVTIFSRYKETVVDDDAKAVAING